MLKTFKSLGCNSCCTKPALSYQYTLQGCSEQTALEGQDVPYTHLAHHEPGSIKHHLPYNSLDAAGNGAKTLFSNGLGAMLPGPVGQLSSRTLADTQDGFRAELGVGVGVVVAEHIAARVPVMRQAVGQLSSSMLTNGQDGFRAGLGVEVAPAEHTAVTGTGRMPKAAGVPVMPQAGSAIAEGGCARAEGGWVIGEDGGTTAEGGDSTAQSGCTRFASEQAQLAPRVGNSLAASQGAAIQGDHSMPEHGAPSTSAVNDDSAAKGTTAGDVLAIARTRPRSADRPHTSFSLSSQGCISTAEGDGDNPAQYLNSALRQLATSEIAAAADNIRAAAPAATAKADAAASQPAAATAAGSLAITQLNCTTAQCRATTAGAADTSPARRDCVLANGDATTAQPPATADQVFPTAASTPSLHVTDAAEKEEDGRLDLAVPEAHLLASATVAQDLSMTDLQFQDDISSEAQGE